jgi:hypothetical protein
MAPPPEAYARTIKRKSGGPAASSSASPAPKGKSANVAKLDASASSPSIGVNDTADVPDNEVNAKYMATVHENLRIIEACPLFADMKDIYIYIYIIYVYIYIYLYIYRS